MRLLALSLAAAVLAGCSSTGTPTGPGAAPSPVPAVEDCGSFHQTSPVAPPITSAGLACFATAVAARRPVRLVSVAPTTEGDPITITYEGKADGTTVVTTDSSRDRFAGTGARYGVQVCRRPQPTKGVLMFAECSDVAPTPS
jgi:hypothetical protein